MTIKLTGKFEQFTHPGGSPSHAFVYIADYVRYFCIWCKLCIGRGIESSAWQCPDMGTYGK